MRAVLLLLVGLAGCAADAGGEPQPIDQQTPEIEITELATSAEAMDVCSLASELPDTDVCSLLCDPPAMAARLLDEGTEGGRCYQLYCALPYEEHVLVGVCLP